MTTPTGQDDQRGQHDGPEGAYQVPYRERQERAPRKRPAPQQPPTQEQETYGTVPGDGWAAPETEADHPLRLLPEADNTGEGYVHLRSRGDCPLCGDEESHEHPAVSPAEQDSDGPDAIREEMTLALLDHVSDPDAEHDAEDWAQAYAVVDMLLALPAVAAALRAARPDGDQ